jgi:WD40 repeat protein/tRNA A-37 threonylcarbamoyl transferase component Bud32
MSTGVTTTENMRKASHDRLRPEERPTIAASPVEIDASWGTILPGYEVLDCLGRGGMGIVYKARHLSLHRQVAIKLLLAGTHASTSAQTRFRAEAEALASLNHPHIVQIHEVGSHNGQLYFVMEYMVGGSLAEHAEAPLPPNQAAQLLHDLAGAIHYAHERGIVHRDLKPGNILLTEDGSAKISDFGVARHLHASEHATRDGAVIGSPGYMSPEQARDQSNLAGPAADVYALGAILYRQLTGQECFGDVSSIAQLRLLLAEDPRPPRRVLSSIPRDLETICLKCLRKEASERYTSARELADDLQRFLNGEPICARPVGRAERLVKWTRRHPAQATICALLFIVALLGVGITLALSLWSQAKEAQQETEVARQAVSDAHDRLQVEQNKTKEALAREEIARKNEEAGRKREEALAARLTVTDYFHRIDLSYRDWSNNQVHQGRAFLALAPPKGLPGWEWDFVKGLSYSEYETVAGHQSEVWGLAIDREEKMLVSSGRDNQLIFWDLKTRRPRRSAHAGAFHVTCVAIHPSGKLAATGSFDRSVRLWDVDGAGLLHTFGGHTDCVKAVAFSPDGKLLISASVDKSIKVWDIEARKELRTLSGHTGAVNCLAFTSDGVLISGSHDYFIRFWNPVSGKLLQSFQAHWTPVLALQLAPDEKQFVSSSADGTIRFWDVASGKQEGEDIRRKQGIYTLAFTRDGKVLAVAGRDAEIQLYDLPGRREREPYRGHLSSVHALHFFSNGDWLVSAGVDHVLHFWHLAGPPRVATLTGHRAAVLGVAFSKDGLLASASHDNTVKLWNTRTCQEVMNLRGLNAPARSIDFHPTLNRLACGASPMGTIIVWDVKTGRELRRIMTPWSMLSCVRYSPDGRYLAAGDGDRKQPGNAVVRMWDAETGKVVRTIPAHQDSVNALAFTPDGRLILTAGGDGYVRGWEAETGKEAFPARDLRAPVMSLAISDDGKQVACGLVNAIVARLSLVRPEIPLVGAHRSAVYSLAWLKGEERLVSASLDGTVKLWHVSSGLEALRLTNQPEECFSVAVSPDGTTIAAGSRNASVKLWATPPRQ